MGEKFCTRRDDLDCGVGSDRCCHGTDTIGAQEAWIQKLVCDPVEILVNPMDESETVQSVLWTIWSHHLV